MLKHFVLILLAINFSALGAKCVCPANLAMPLPTLENQLKQDLTKLQDYIIFSHSPTGLTLSIKDELIFDQCGEINIYGKFVLNSIAPIIKQSGRKWLILCHTTQGKTQIDKISKTSQKAGTITNYLTDKETCLINQIFPIGFGSIMPLKSDEAASKKFRDRIDFVTEEFNLY